MAKQMEEDQEDLNTAHDAMTSDAMSAMEQKNHTKEDEDSMMVSGDIAVDQVAIGFFMSSIEDVDVHFFQLHFWTSDFKQTLFLNSNHLKEHSEPFQTTPL